MEGAKVHLDHPDRKQPHAERSVETSFGILRNLRDTPSGLRADLHYNRQHPFAARMIEDVERRMGSWGFSPNAVGVGQVRDGMYVVEEFVQVRSCDLVSDPATTVNLAESRSLPMPTTFRDLLESALPKVRGPRRVTLCNFLEQGYMAAAEMKPGEMTEEEPNLGDVPVEPTSDDPMEALAGGFQSALNACVTQFISGEMSEADFLAKVKDLAKTFGKLGTGAPAAAETPESDQTDDKAEDDKPEMKESISLAARERAELLRLRSEKEVAALCESLAYKPSAVEVEALVGLQESRRVELVKEFIGRERRPVSQSPQRVALPTPTPRVAKQQPAETPDAFLAAIKK